jgi:hypothetical protein
MAQSTAVKNLVGLVQDPLGYTSADGTSPPFSSGRAGELIVSELRGELAVANDRGHIFGARAAGITLPAIGLNLVSTFALYNPVGSGINMELVDLDIGNVLATTVVDMVGLYYSNGNNAATATFTTPGTIQSGIIGGSNQSRGQFYSALTHVGTPGLAGLIGGFGAVTASNFGTFHYDFNGKLIIPEGTILSVAMTTAASTASGITLGARWLEYLNK